MTINEANALYVGAAKASAAYAGINKVWPKVAAPFITSIVTTSNVRDDFDGLVGCRFQVGSKDLFITDFGRYVRPGRTGAGTHALNLYDNSGSGIVLATATVDTTSQPTGTFVYAALSSPFKVLAGTIYFLLSREFAHSGDTWNDNDCVPTTTADGTVTSAAYAYPGGAPTLAQQGQFTYGPPNFRYYT